MPIPIICPCTAKLRVGDHLLGQHIKCPRCGAIHPVGDAASPVAGHASAPAPAGGGLSEEEQERLDDILEDGEQVVWAGKPDAATAARAGRIIGYISWGLAGVLLVILAIVLVDVGGSGAAIGIAVVVGLLTVAFVAAGFGLPLYMGRRAGNTVYAFTDQRALSWTPALGGKFTLRTFTAAKVAGMTCQGVTAEGVGSLIFESERFKSMGPPGEGPRGPSHGGFIPAGFYYIRDVRAVEKLMRERLVNPHMDQLDEAPRDRRGRARR
jgi:hypothetical protein